MKTEPLDFYARYLKARDSSPDFWSSREGASGPIRLKLRTAWQSPLTKNRHSIVPVGCLQETQRPETERSERTTRRPHCTFASSLNPYRTTLSAPRATDALPRPRSGPACTRPERRRLFERRSHLNRISPPEKRREEVLVRVPEKHRREEVIVCVPERHRREEVLVPVQEKPHRREELIVPVQERNQQKEVIVRREELIVSDIQQARSEGVRLSQCRNHLQTLEMALVSKHIPKSEMMIQFLYKRGIEENRKVFVFDGPDEHIRQSLLRRGFVENPKRSSVLWDFKWCVTDLEEDYKSLQGCDLYNHFQNNRELTTKAALLKNLHQYQCDEPVYGMSDDFFPRCYDMSSLVEREDFILDYCRQCALLVLRRHQKLLSMKSYVCNIDMLEVAKQAIRRWANELDPDVEAVFRDITLDDWDSLVVYSELNEDQLCQRKSVFVARRERRRGYRSAGANECEQVRSEDAISRPLDIHKWVEFQHHTWGEPQKLESDIKRMMKTISLLPQQALLGPLNVWIVKPGTNSKGSGIQCMHRLREILHHCDSVTNRVVQKYIEKPLLLFSGRKFDIRQWVLIQSIEPLKVFMYNDCYLRLCNEPYDLGDLANRQRHISNWAVNKMGKNVQAGGYIEGGCAPLSILQDELVAITGNPHYWAEVVLPQLERIILNTIRAAQKSIVGRSQCFELFGFDIMIDEFLNPWLLEVNLSPACDARMPFLSTMLIQMSESLLDLLLDDDDKEDAFWRCICDETMNRQRGMERDEVGRSFTGQLTIVGKSLHFRHERKLELAWLRQDGRHLLQRVGRGFLGRLHATRLRKLRSTRLIQRLWRGYTGRQRARRRRLTLHVLVIQGALRRNMAILQLRNQQDKIAATSIQCLVRVFLARRKTHHARLAREATRIQRYFLQRRARIRTKASHKLAIWWREITRTRNTHAIRLQRTIRMVCQRRRYEAALDRARAWFRLSSALSLSRWRSRLDFLHTTSMAQRIQARVRGNISRKAFYAKRTMHYVYRSWHFLATREITATRCMQRVTRGFFGRRIARIKEAEVIHLKILLRYRWRFFQRQRERRKQEMSENRETMAVKLQCFFRVTLARSDRDKRLQSFRAAKSIQKRWRGIQARAFVKHKREVLQKKAKWRHLAAVVQKERTERNATIDLKKRTLSSFILYRALRTESSIFIQYVFRRARRRRASLKIQKTWRGFCGRIFFSEYKTCWSAIKLVQRAWRRHRGRLMAKKRRAVRLIQRIWRGHRGREDYTARVRKQKWRALQAAVEAERKQLLNATATIERMRADEMNVHDRMRQIDKNREEKYDTVSSTRSSGTSTCAPSETSHESSPKREILNRRENTNNNSPPRVGDYRSPLGSPQKREVVRYARSTFSSSAVSDTRFPDEVIRGGCASSIRNVYGMGLPLRSKWHPDSNGLIRLEAYQRTHVLEKLSTLNKRFNFDRVEQRRDECRNILLLEGKAARRWKTTDLSEEERIASSVRGSLVAPQRKAYDRIPVSRYT